MDNANVGRKMRFQEMAESVSFLFVRYVRQAAAVLAPAGICGITDWEIGYSSVRSKGSSEDFSEKSQAMVPYKNRIQITVESEPMGS